MKQKLFLLILGTAAMLMGGQTMGQQARRTIYIVRHAEKDTGSNPALSAIGRQRAGDLYRALKHKKIDLIMATQYRRTGMTADSLRIYMKIDSIVYRADANGDNFLKTLQTRAGNAKNILVVGHSNTIPALIRKAGILSYTIKELPETEYDNLFVIKQKKGKATMEQKKIGKPSM